MSINAFNACQSWDGKPVLRKAGTVTQICEAKKVPASLLFGQYTSVPLTSLSENGELGPVKFFIQRLSSLVLQCLPKSVFGFLESVMLYPGSTVLNLGCNLEATKKSWLFSMAKINKADEVKPLLDRFREVRFESSPGLKNRAWYAPAQSGKPTILFSMGNGWSLSNVMAYLELARRGCGMLAYEYPGYGQTSGQPSQQSLCRSLEAASDFLIREESVPVSAQIAYGISLGGAVTVDVASRRHFKAVILESTMTRFADVVRNWLQSHRIPPWLLPLHEHVQSEFDSISKIAKIRCPMLVMHGTADPLVPYSCAKALYEQAGTPQDQKSLQSFPLPEHNLMPTVTVKPIINFLENLVE
ncbi:MAG TPA: alpha/beta fold hydrolase [Coleofasciculaceae cyanobacterium]